MQRKKDELTLIGTVCLAIVGFLCIGSVAAADQGTASTTITTGPVIFDEQFSAPTLDSAWTFNQVPGRGRYSLTDNPGSFRLIGEGSRTGQALTWWDPTWSHSWPGGSYLIRTFAGDRWVLRTSTTYHLHGSSNGDSTGAQDARFAIAFGDGKGPKLDFARLVDYWYTLSILGISLQNAEGGVPMTFPDDDFKSIDDAYHYIGSEGWIEHTYWYEVVRDGQQVTVSISTDGTTYTPVRSFTLPSTTGATQRMALYHSEWAQVGSSSDWDYISVYELAGSPPSPVTADAGGPYLAAEGSPVSLSAAGSTGTGPFTFDWDLDGDGVYDDLSTSETTATYTWTDDFAGTIGVRVTDAGGYQATDTATVTISNADPVISSLTVPVSVVALGTSITANAVFSDAGTADTHTIFWDWTDGTDDATTQPHAAVPGTITETHTYTAPGVYPVVLYVDDDDGGSAVAIASAFVVVFDPSAGFVTGGGWIDSPPGAYPAEPTVSGKASFSFVSKYHRGAGVPTGQMQYVLQDAGFRFHSTDYDWLVVAGNQVQWNRVQFMGSGTVNGQDGYGFMLTAIDDAPDLLRLKVWEKATDTVVYDNQAGDMDVAALTWAIGGGSIVVHK